MNVLKHPNHFLNHYDNQEMTLHVYLESVSRDQQIK